MLQAMPTLVHSMLCYTISVVVVKSDRQKFIPFYSWKSVLHINFDSSSVVTNRLDANDYDDIRVCSTNVASEMISYTGVSNKIFSPHSQFAHLQTFTLQVSVADLHPSCELNAVVVVNVGLFSYPDPKVYLPCRFRFMLSVSKWSTLDIAMQPSKCYFVFCGTFVVNVGYIYGS